MARVKLEAGTGIAGFSGRIGNLVFRMSAEGTTYVQQAPAPGSGPGSAAQQHYRRHFGAAARYGRAQQASAAGRAYYQPFVRPARFASVYSVALADFLKPPQIVAVEVGAYRGQAGEQLRIQAHDPYGVTAVRLVLRDAAGRELEQGEAEPEEGGWWSYTTICSHLPGAVRQVVVTARDRPGNAAELVVDLE
ncbi:hypothetical protein KLP40_12390 [Hymenobacter sp. NST-14]|uniref:hypothetical protein n=1 Tax=Hymenobacter piscis TaxID=2839984 RepID=UPI001C03398D|nr:hypothetical protein [Hymenobacter piscis]MBT9393964.1 hypothetical protein [Hymenobacter piscis]